MIFTVILFVNELHLPMFFWLVKGYPLSIQRILWPGLLAGVAWPAMPRMAATKSLLKNERKERGKSSGGHGLVTTKLYSDTTGLDKHFVSCSYSKLSHIPPEDNTSWAPPMCGISCNATNGGDKKSHKERTKGKRKE